MTREEALKRVKGYLTDCLPLEDSGEIDEIMDALEQEPCTDAVSRQAIYEELEKWEWQELYLPIHFKENIVDVLPPVTPTRPTEWIPVSERLPEAFEHCLWTTTNGDVIYHHWDGLISKYKAWMPLPNPYTEIKEGEA